MAGFALKIKMKEGQQIVKTLTGSSSVKELKEVLCQLSNIPLGRLQVLSGYPPKCLELCDSSNLTDSGINSGDTLILEELPPQKAQNDLNQQTDSLKKANQSNDVDSTPPRGILMKHVVPADNSCLFTSIFFVLNGKTEGASDAATYMRQLVAETIRNDPTNYSEAILGKPIDKYCEWIQDDKSWGGAIELSILANHYGVEIVAVDTINAIINRFGEDQSYPHRVFLLFDGIHYDPLYLEPFDGSKIETIFPAEDERLLQEAVQLAQEAKSSRQFTDVDKFTLKCLVCNVCLKGQTQAQEHARQTGHMNFGEV